MHGARTCRSSRARPLLRHKHSRHAGRSRQQGRLRRTARNGARPIAAMQLQVARCRASRPGSDASLVCLGCQHASQLMRYAMICRVWRTGRPQGKQDGRSCRVRQPQPAVSASGSATAASGCRHSNRRSSFGYVSCRACTASSDANPEHQTCQQLWRIVRGARKLQGATGEAAAPHPQAQLPHGSQSCPRSSRAPAAGPGSGLCPCIQCRRSSRSNSSNSS